MNYLIANAQYPIQYISSGKWICEDGFLHKKRNLDYFVLLLVIEGILHIHTGEDNYDVGPNQCILLIANRTHYGYKPTSGKIVYFYVHFYVTDPHYQVYFQENNRYLDDFLNIDYSNNYIPELYVIPEFIEFSSVKPVLSLFPQLISLSKREHYQPTFRCHYALSYMLLEITYEFLFSRKMACVEEIPPRLFQITEWIKHNFDKPLTVKLVSEKFNYHPSYISQLFKQYTGYSLLAYINRVKLDAAKNLIVNSNLPIYTVSYMCGFNDDKYFMKLFKKYEGIAPMQYRKAFLDATIKELDNNNA